MEALQLVNSYPRKNAIETGSLVDISDIAKEIGFTVPIACTSSLFKEVFTPSHQCKLLGQKVENRVWDMITSLMHTAKDALDPKIILRMEVAYEFTTVIEEMVAIVGPGDERELVVTIMYKHENKEE